MRIRLVAILAVASLAACLDEPASMERPDPAYAPFHADDHDAPPIVVRGTTVVDPRKPEASAARTPARSETPSEPAAPEPSVMKPASEPIAKPATKSEEPVANAETRREPATKAPEPTKVEGPKVEPSPGASAPEPTAERSPRVAVRPAAEPTEPKEPVRDVAETHEPTPRGQKRVEGSLPVVERAKETGKHAPLEKKPEGDPLERFAGVWKVRVLDVRAKNPQGAPGDRSDDVDPDRLRARAPALVNVSYPGPRNGIAQQIELVGERTGAYVGKPSDLRCAGFSDARGSSFTIEGGMLGPLAFDSLEGSLTEVTGRLKLVRKVGAAEVTIDLSLSR